MRDFRFVIPIKLEDLTQSSGEFDVYFVQIEYTSREVVHKLNGIYFISIIPSINHFFFKTLTTITNQLELNIFLKISMFSTVVLSID